MVRSEGWIAEEAQKYLTTVDQQLMVIVVINHHDWDKVLDKLENGAGEESVEAFCPKVNSSIYHIFVQHQYQ